jgi:hypothetical protein
MRAMLSEYLVALPWNVSVQEGSGPATGPPHSSLFVLSIDVARQFDATDIVQVVQSLGRKHFGCDGGRCKHRRLLMSIVSVSGGLDLIS